MVQVSGFWLHGSGFRVQVSGFRFQGSDSDCFSVPCSDMGHKIGLNGVDNAKLSFSNVRIPASQLLDRISAVTADGKFSSKVKGLRDRFLCQAEQLISGRLCIAAMMLALCKVGLAISVRFVGV